MAANPIVGFSAAGTAAGLVPGAHPNPGAGNGGIPGGFARLLAALLGTANVPEADAAAATALALAPEAATTEAAAPVLPDITETVRPEFAVPAAPDAIPADPDKLPAAVAPLLLDLLRALAALETAVQSSQPVDPQLRQQLDEAVEALATYFELPAATAKDVAGPLAAPLLPAAASAEPAPAGAAPPAAGSSAVPEAAAAAAPPKAPEAAARPAVAPAPLLARLAEKLQSMGAALDAAEEPDLAGRLHAVAARLMSGRIDPQKLAAIGLDAEAVKADTPLAKALELLLRPAPEAKPAAPPPPFTAATLALPPEVAAPRSERQALQAPPRPETPAPAAPEPQVAEPAPNSRAADRPTAPEAGPPSRNAVGPPPAREPASAEAKPLPVTAAATAVAATAAAGARTVHAAYQAPPQQPNLPQVAFEMVRQFQAGNSRFQIRLDPPELGRIDVRMDMDRDGNIMARMTVERSETLDLMQRDQRALERALAQAGLDSARTSLEFSLRHQGSGREQREGGEPVFRDGNGTVASEPDAPPPPGITHHRGLASPSGVNLFV